MTPRETTPEAVPPPGHSWLRRILPDLVLVTVVALAVTVGVHYQERRESAWITARMLEVDRNPPAGFVPGISARIEVLEASMVRTMVRDLPALVLAAGFLTGGLRRRGRRHAWAWGVGAGLPATLMAIGFVIDNPLAVGVVVVAYAAAGAGAATAGAGVRRLLGRAEQADEEGHQADHQRAEDCRHQ